MGISQPLSPLPAKRPRAEARGSLVVLSNRLPVALHLTDAGEVTLRDTAGGLATALGGMRSEVDFSWIGWPGQTVPSGLQTKVREAMRPAGYTPVFVPHEFEDAYYNGMCNSVIWPLFHYFLGRVHFEPHYWQAYVEVNEAFANAAAAHAPADAHVWIHDYHLMLVPSLLRARRPDLTISFFLHIPFPSSELYRTLPARGELLTGLLGADYIGFHTSDYVRHFRSSCLRVLGVDSGFDHLVFQGRRVGLGAHPIGPDVTRLRQALATPAGRNRLSELGESWEGRKVLLGVERLDYSKAIPLKLLAFEEFLRRDPRRAETTTLVQVVVPSRLDTDEYRDLKEEIERLVGRINGQYGSPGVTPLQYLHRQFDVDELAPLYRSADVGIVLPARDGMNLVAQEFALCQGEPLDDDHVPGVLLLSEFAGSAHSLSRAILTNPWDTYAVADALEEALAMDPDERRERMDRMRDRVLNLDCQLWARRFLDAATTVAEHEAAARRAQRLTSDDEAELVAAFRSAPRRVLLLDYDGTLRELTRRPLDARPTPEIRTLLTQLAAIANTEVHVISGRDRRTLTAWLGDLPVAMCAEHGFAFRPKGQTTWEIREDVDLRWLPKAEEILHAVELEVDDSEVERKPCSVAWHYRMVDGSYGDWRARELRMTLEDQFAHDHAEILAGHKVLEIRAAGVQKGDYVRNLDLADAFVLAIGDDRTDIDTYAALPPGAVAIHVGAGGEHNRYRVDSPAEVRALLARLRRAML